MIGQKMIGQKMIKQKMIGQHHRIRCKIGRGLQVGEESLGWEFMWLAAV